MKSANWPPAFITIHMTRYGTADKKPLWRIKKIKKIKNHIQYLNTLSVKRNFFRATLTKILRIKINHIWTQISYSSPHQAHLRTKGCLCQKGRKKVVRSKSFFFKTHRNGSSHRFTICQTQKRVHDYITHYENEINLFAFAIECSE